MSREGLMVSQDFGHWLVLENGETIVIDTESQEEEEE